MNIDEPPDDSTATGRAGRPLGLTIACVVSGLGLALAMLAVGIRWDLLRDISPGRRVAALAVPAFLLLTLIGYWKMRRWALWVVLAALIVRISASAAGVLLLRPADIAMPLSLLVLGLIYWRRLR